MLNKISTASLLGFFMLFAFTLASPQVGSYKFEFKKSALNNMLALGFGTNSEIFLGYKVPLKSDRQYLALQPKLETTVVHRNWFSMTFFFVNVKFSLDAEAAKFAPYFKIMLDQITYNDVCLDFGYLLSALELNLYT